MVIPVGYGRDGDDLFIHGSTASRLLRAMAGGERVCVTVTLLDGLVVARSAFESSMHYRSAVIFGSGRPLESDEKAHALRVVTEHLQPGRWATLREPLAKELTGYLDRCPSHRRVVGEGVEQATRRSAGGRGRTSWAGVVPMHTTVAAPIDAPDLREGIDVPVEVARWHR